MLVQRRLFHVIALILVLALVLAACERPIPGGDEGDEVITDTTTETTSEEAGESEPAASGAEEEPAAESTESEESDTPRVEEEETATESEETEEVAEESAEAETESTEATEEAAESTDESATESEEEAEAETTEEATAEEATEETTEEAEAETTEEASDTPQTHTVAAGETLYRIGLKYGISWVTLAEHNNLANANQIKVGQVLNIPGGTTDDSEAAAADPTPSPLTETTYTIKAGDNLYRIGQAYGISWVQIAEANGIVNPNQIIVGQELKIPVDTPGPAPQFTHQVQTGETLFLISLRYGVSWTTIAEANDISSPYVIYVGQSLVIPGGE